MMKKLLPLLALLAATLLPIAPALATPAGLDGGQLTYVQVQYYGGAFHVNAWDARVSAADLSYNSVGDYTLDLSAIVPGAIVTAWANVEKVNGGTVQGSSVHLVPVGRTLDINALQFTAGAFSYTDGEIVDLLVLYY